MRKIQTFFLILLLSMVFFRVLFSLLFPLHLKNGQVVNFQTTLLSEPSQKPTYESLTVPYSKGWSTVPLTVILPPNADVHYGQTVIISGTVKVKALQGGKIIFLTYQPKIFLNNFSQNPLFDVSFFFRNRIKDLYESFLSSESATLLLGIVLGVKGNFAANFLSDLQATGVMHVIAASGMNVTMVGGFFLGLFGVFLKRQWAVTLTSAVLLFYCILSGLQASILRATIMMVFALVAQLLGRQYSGLYGLLLAACGMLLYNPTWVSDIGFQLSFAATAGIFFIKPLLPQWGIFTDDVGTTIAAQIATVPLLVGAFGSYGLLSLVVNALVLWTIPPLMVLGGIGGLIGLVFPLAGQILIVLCEPLLWFFESIVRYFGTFHWEISLTSLPWEMISGYYLLVGSWVWIQKKTSRALVQPDMKKQFQQ